MRCLYEVLDLERDADDAQIKIAYRKGALRWHPDKNQSNLKEAEERFKELQNAYEVLSDKHERSWYDAHRIDILRGGGHQAGGGGGFTPGQAPPEDVNLYPYFSSACFSGYSDGPSGFYGVYERLFTQLAKQEAEAECQADQKNEKDWHDPPLFGTSTAPWSQVSGFYSYWLHFSTSKSFAWADKHNPASAPNRKVRRLMEADNLKARKASRREFNELVQELATFVRKRDKRVAAYQAEQAQKRIQKEAEDQARRDEERRERLQRAREFEAAAWAQEDFEDEAVEAAAAVVPDELYCIACDKSFRSKNALTNHEKSKKHLEKLEVLRQALEEEGELSADPSGSSSTSASENEHSDATESLDALSQNGASEKPDNGALEASEKANRGAALPSSSSENEEEAEVNGEEDMLEALLRLQAGKAAARPAAADAASQNGNGSRDAAVLEEDETSSTEGAAAAAEDPIAEATEQLAGASLRADGTGQAAEEHSSSSQKLPKRKSRQKRSDGPSVTGPAAKTKAGKRRQKAGEEQTSEIADPTCSVCGSCFASRTKLFQHIKDAGHAAPKR